MRNPRHSRPFEMTNASEWRSGKGHRDENFPVASWIIHPRHRALILAFYNFVRTADDIADHATLSESDKLALPHPLETRLARRGGQPGGAGRLAPCTGGACDAAPSCARRLDRLPH